MGTDTDVLTCGYIHFFSQLGTFILLHWTPLRTDPVPTNAAVYLSLHFLSWINIFRSSIV